MPIDINELVDVQVLFKAREDSCKNKITYNPEQAHAQHMADPIKDGSIQGDEVGAHRKPIV